MEIALYLIPVTLGETSTDQVLPSYNHDIIMGIRHFIVENVRSARRFLRQTDREFPIDDSTFYEMGKHADEHQFSQYLQALRDGKPMGVISEAGCPAVADPGADIVAIAQRQNLRVIPLVGPSSMIMAVMAIQNPYNSCMGPNEDQYRTLSLACSNAFLMLMVISIISILNSQFWMVYLLISLIGWIVFFRKYVIYTKQQAASIRRFGLWPIDDGDD